MRRHKQNVPSGTHSSKPPCSAPLEAVLGGLCLPGCKTLLCSWFIKSVSELAPFRCEFDGIGYWYGSCYSSA